MVLAPPTETGTGGSEVETRARDLDVGVKRLKQRVDSKSAHCVAPV